MINLENYLKGKGLFVFSDPGGAKPVLALVLSLKNKLTDFKVISNREYSFYNEFGIHVDKPLPYPEEDISAFSPDFIFTGTSYTSKIELGYIKAGTGQGIPVYAFVDHWTNIRERFSDNGAEILPDKICLIDERAKTIAEGQGINESMILVSGNPFQDYLRSWKPVQKKEEFFRSNNIDHNDKKIIVFAPDPLSNVDGISKFGFDEVQVSKELSEIIEDTSDKFIFIFKPHPNQDLSKLDSKFLKTVIVAPPGIENNSLIYHSDIILGFFSSYLLEAEIMNKKVLRYLPEGYKNDPFQDNNIGAIVNRKTLVENLNHLI